MDTAHTWDRADLLRARLPSGHGLTFRPDDVQALCKGTGRRYQRLGASPGADGRLGGSPG